jgi:hypothetical protein
MSKEVTYDTTDQVDVIKGHPAEEVVSASVNDQTGTAGACVSEELKNANLANSENSEILKNTRLIIQLDRMTNHNRCAPRLGPCVLGFACVAWRQFCRDPLAVSTA